MTAVRRRGAALAGLTTTAVVIAVAVWLIPASVHVVGWTGGVATRVALVPPLDGLVRLLGAAGAVVLATALATWRRPDRVTAFARTAAPLGWLGLWAIPYLPWLPDRLPLLLVLAGPVRWIVAAGALGWAGTRVVSALRHTDPVRSGWVWPTPGRRAVFVVSLCLVAATG